jgi:hypothetical protein
MSWRPTHHVQWSRPSPSNPRRPLSETYTVGVSTVEPQIHVTFIRPRVTADSSANLDATSPHELPKFIGTKPPRSAMNHPMTVRT